MAGTRLTLILVYTIEVIALIFLAYYQSVRFSKHSSSENFSGNNNNNNWSRIHYPFKTDRSGIPYLNTLATTLGAQIILIQHAELKNDDDGDNYNQDDDSIFVFLKNMERNFQRVLLHENTVQFQLIHHYSHKHKDQHQQEQHHDKDKDESVLLVHDRQELMNSLQFGLDHFRNNTSVGKHHITIQSSKVISSSEVNTRTIGNYCNDDINFDSIANILKNHSETKRRNELFVYDIHLIYNCDNKLEQNDETTQKIEIELNEYGTIIIRIPTFLSSNHELMNQLLEEKVSRFLTEHFLTLPSNGGSLMTSKFQHLLSTTKLKVTTMLIDSDPMSYSHAKKDSDLPKRTAMIGPIEHHQLISTIFQEQMNQSIANMIDMLSFSDNSTGLFQSTQMDYNGMTFAGQDLAQNAVFSEYDNVDVPDDYTISISHAKDIILNGEIGHSITGANDIKDDVDESVWNIILYVPPKTQTPLFVLNDNVDDERQSWSQAFVVKSKDTTISIVNIEDVNDELDKKGMEFRQSVYTSALRAAISHVGSSIRQQLGLSGFIPKIEEDSITTNEDGEIVVEFHFIQTSSKRNGIASWEVDKLLRQSLIVKVEKVTRVLERVVTLVRSRQAIAFRLEVSTRRCRAAFFFLPSLLSVKYSMTD